MNQSISKFFKKMWPDLQRMGLIFAALVSLSLADSFFDFSGDYSFLTSVLTSAAIIFIIASISHILRRILFPYIDLKAFSQKALTEPLAASIVFLGVCVMLATFIVVNVLLLA